MYRHYGIRGKKTFFKNFAKFFAFPQATHFATHFNNPAKGKKATSLSSLLCGQNFSPFCTSPFQYQSSTDRLHSLAKSMSSLFPQYIRLISSLHFHNTSLKQETRPVVMLTIKDYSARKIMCQ